MPNIALASVTDPNLPEPKGASTATQGQVYVADGAGSGVWADSSISTYGVMTITGNSTATVVAAAADATLHTNTDYTAVGNWSAGTLSNVTMGTNVLTLANTGNYRLSFWATVKIPKNNNFVGIKYVVNGVTYSTQRLVTQSHTANDYALLTADSIVPFAANDTIGIAMACTLGDSIVVEDAGMCVVLL